MKDNPEPYKQKIINKYSFLNKDLISNQRKNRFKNNNIFVNDNKENDKIYRISYNRSPSKIKNRIDNFKTPIKSNLLNFEKNFLNLNSNIKNRSKDKNIKSNNLRVKSSIKRDVSKNIDINIIDSNIPGNIINNIKTIGNINNNIKNNNSYMSTYKAIQELKLTIRKTISKVYDIKSKEKNEEMNLKLKNIILDLKNMLYELEVLEKNKNNTQKILTSKLNEITNETKRINNTLIIIVNEQKEEKIRNEKEENEKQINIKEIKKIEFEERCRKRLQEMRRRKIEDENQRQQELNRLELEKNERRLMIEERIRKLEDEIRIRNLGRRGLSNNRNNNRNNLINNLNDVRINHGNNNQDDISKIFLQLPEYKITNIQKISKEFNHCIICLDDFRLNDILIYLPCFHPFHKECIFKWLKRNVNCPICLLDIKENLNTQEF